MVALQVTEKTFDSLQPGMVAAAALDELVRKATALDMDEVHRSIAARSTLSPEPRATGGRPTEAQK